MFLQLAFVNILLGKHYNLQWYWVHASLNFSVLVAKMYKYKHSWLTKCHRISWSKLISSLLDLPKSKAMGVLYPYPEQLFMHTSLLGCDMYLLKAKKRVVSQPTPPGNFKSKPHDNEKYKNRQPRIDTNGKLPGIIKICKVNVFLLWLWLWLCLWLVVKSNGTYKIRNHS